MKKKSEEKKDVAKNKEVDLVEKIESIKENQGQKDRYTNDFNLNKNNSKNQCNHNKKNKAAKIWHVLLKQFNIKRKAQTRAQTIYDAEYYKIQQAVNDAFLKVLNSRISK